MTEQVNVSVGDGQKQRWEQYVGQTPEFRTTSELVRTAVEKEIDCDQDEEGQAEPPALAIDIQEISSEVQQIRRDVSWIREQEQQRNDVSELANEIYDQLESIPAHLRDETHGAITTIDMCGPQTVQALSEQVEAHPNEVRDALDVLYDNFHPITSKTIDGEVHWFKEE